MYEAHQANIASVKQIVRRDVRLIRKIHEQWRDDVKRRVKQCMEKVESDVGYRTLPAANPSEKD